MKQRVFKYAVFPFRCTAVLLLALAVSDPAYAIEMHKEVRGKQLEKGAQPAAGQQSYSAGSDGVSALVSEALANNRALKAHREDYRAARESISPAGALPNPGVQFTYFLESPETRVGPQEYAFSIMQRFPFLGKLSSRERRAFFNAAAAREMWIAAFLDTVMKTKKTYYDLCYVDSAIRITEEDKEVLRHFEEISRTRYATGSGIEQAVIKIQAEMTRDDDRLISLTRDRIATLARLNALLDKPTRTPVTECETPDPPSALPAHETLLGQALEAEPVLRARLWRTRSADQEIRYAKRDFFPDLTGGFSFISVGEREDALGVANPPEDNGKNAYGITAGLSLPLWFGKQKDNLDRAKANRSTAENTYFDRRNEVEAAIEDVAATLSSLRQQIQLYENVLIVQVDEALRSAKASYTTGKLGALDLIDAERVVLAVRLTHARLRSEFWKAHADAERWSGAALDPNQAVPVVKENES